MDDMNIIDRFMQAFVTYIDTGFGLLGGDVGFLVTILIGIDITLAGLFWALGGEDDVIGKFLKKILYVGAFALILNNWPLLTDIIFRSFAGLGLTAGGGVISAEDLLMPGRLAGVGFEAAWPLLLQAKELVGPIDFFNNFIEIIVLCLAWLIVIAAFFVLAAQVFVCMIEFKLTALLGFVLVPFALWNRTTFMAERVFGAVVSAGVKIMVIAVIVGIGSNFFSELTSGLQGQEVDLAQVMTLALASLVFGLLAIFCPSLAAGLIAGAPQLGAGAAVATAALAGGTIIMGGAGALGAARGAGGAGLGALRAGTSMGSAASTAYKLGQETSGSSTVGAGIGGIATAARGAAAQKIAANTSAFKAAAERGQQAAWDAGTTSAPGAASAAAGGAGSGATPPAWAQKLHATQSSRHRRQMAIHAIQSGDRGGAGAAPDIKERD